MVLLPEYAGLEPQDWHALKDLVLGAAYGAGEISIPPRLRSHPAAQHLQSFLTSRDKKHLDKAAEALCPLHPDTAWLALMKS